MNRPNGHSIAKTGPVHVLIDSTGFEVYGAGQGLEDKHGAKSRRGWRKLHLALDADSGEIIAHAVCQESRVRACIMGTKEITHGRTERADHPG